MEAALAGLVENLPEIAPFVLRTGGVLLAGTGIFFALRKTLVGRGLARLADRGLEILVAVVLLGMVFLSGLQILLRNFFDAGLLWIDPLLRHLVLVLAFAGAILATSSKRHVQINVLGRLLRGWAGRIGGTIIALLGAVLSLLLVHASLQLLGEEIAFGGEVFLSIPSWVIVLVFPVAFLTIAFRLVLMAFQELAGEAPVSAEEQEADAARSAADADDVPEAEAS